MPIYLVRWPGSSLSIIRTQNKTELMDIIDEVGDPTQCRIKEYHGPLFVSLNLKLDYKMGRDGEILLQDVSHCLKSPELELAEDYGDTIYDMKDEILRFAFPAYHKYIINRNPEQEPDMHDELLCKDALQLDLKEPIEPSLKRRIDQSLKWADAMGILEDDQSSTKRGNESHE